jgi:Domain of unknown function (DUF5916)/Carbohydrate family 9 binding domain-like
MRQPGYLFLLIATLAAISTSAQKKNDNYNLHIHKATSPIKIDGVMDEQAWKDAEVADSFWMVLPMDTSRARVTTDVRMTYDDQNLYIIAVCHLLKPGPYMVESLARDFSFNKNDNFIFFIDPFDDRTNGFTFGANAAGAQWDGTLYAGGSADLNWDTKWRSAVKQYKDKWIFEAAIPFKSIRYKKGRMRWGINFSRLDIKAAEKSSWAPVPRQFPTAALAYTGNLIWDAPPPTPKFNISVIPYVLTGVSKDFEANSKPSWRHTIGGDAKIAVTSSLNLDLTVNPDFSEVDVDQQVINLDRYELFFPEKRQFFLENSDLFGNFGYTNIQPFFSRRIGLNVPIDYGARLSGSINKNWRIGVMDMQTRAQADTALPAQNFAVVALERRVFSRSNIRVIFVNKNSIDYHIPHDTSQPVYSQFNRVIGAEYNLASANNLWTGKLMMLKSFSPGVNNHDLVQTGNLQYQSKKWLLSMEYDYVGSNFIAEVGYVPRNNYIKLNPVAGYLFFPKSGPILSHGPKITSTYYFNEQWQQTDNETFTYYTLNFRDQSTLDAWVAHDYVELLASFDPTHYLGDTLATGTRHHWNSFGTDYVSKPQKLLTWDLSTRFGGYYANGSLCTITGDIGYRFQPYVNLSINVNYNHINLPQPWGINNFWLIGPKIVVTMTNKLFFTTFIQYNEQLQNINLNARFQWRYSPASDIFLVYTDNYYPAPFSVRNRALVLKFNYWWNL